MTFGAFLSSVAHDTVICLDTDARRLAHKPFGAIYEAPHRFHPLWATSVKADVRFSLVRGGDPLKFDGSGRVNSDGDYSSLMADANVPGGVTLSVGSLHLSAEESGALTLSSDLPSHRERFSAVTTREMFLRLRPFIPSEASKDFKTGRLTALASCDFYGRDAEIVHNVRVCATDWTILRVGGHMLRPEMSHLRRMNKGVYKTWFAGLRPTNGRPIASACLIGGYYNFYHHLLDYTLNYFSVAPFISKELPLIIPRAVLPFQKDALAIFGLDRHPLIELESLDVVKVENLIVPRKAILGDGIVNDIDALNACRAHMLAKSRGIQRPKRIFISRRRASIRRALNEAEAITLATKYGFVGVVLEDMSLAEQIDHFLNAEAVVGLHGAGFTHLAYAPRGCGVVEIMHAEGWRPDAFQNLSNGLGHRFHRVSTIAGTHGSTDLVIDLDAFEKALQAIA